MFNNRSFLAAFAIFFLAILPYLQTLNFEFAYDDLVQIEKNPLVTESTVSLGKILTTPTPPGDLYRPVSTLSYKLDFFLYGLNSSGYHLTNCLLFGICSVLTYHLLLIISLNPLASFVAALPLAIHPLRSEAVANISGRAEILAAIFGITTILLFYKIKGERSSYVKGIFTVLSIFTLILSILSKESGIIFLPILALLLSKDSSIEFKGKFFTFCAYTLPVALILYLRFKIVTISPLAIANDELKVENPLFNLSFFERLIPTLTVLGDYILQIVLPFKLSADYSLRLDDLYKYVFSISGILSATISVALIGFLLINFKKKTFFWLSWFFISFLVTSNIFFPIGTIRGDRLTFTPAIGLIPFFIFMLFEYTKDKKHKFLPFFVLFCLIALYEYKLFIRIPVWKNNRALFTQTLIDAPLSPKAKYNLAVHYMVAENNLRGAEELFIETLKLIPQHLLSMRALADIALKSNQPLKLEYWYREILKITPDDRQVRNNLQILLKQKD